MKEQQKKAGYQHWMLDKNGNLVIPCEFRQIIRKGDFVFCLKNGMISQFNLNQIESSGKEESDLDVWEGDEGFYTGHLEEDGSYLIQNIALIVL